MAKRRNKSEERDVAVRRIDTLLDLAHRGTVFAHRYAELALAVSQKYQTGLTLEQKVRVCRKCHAPRTSATSRTRIRGGFIVTTCTCGFLHRRRLGEPHARVNQQANPGEARRGSDPGRHPPRGQARRQ